MSVADEGERDGEGGMRPRSETGRTTDQYRKSAAAAAAAASAVDRTRLQMPCFRVCYDVYQVRSTLILRSVLIRASLDGFY